jgi:hypothetical protein
MPQFYIVLRNDLDLENGLKETPKIYRKLQHAKNAANQHLGKHRTPKALGIKYNVYEITLDSDYLTLVEE